MGGREGLLRDSVLSLSGGCEGRAVTWFNSLSLVGGREGLLRDSYIHIYAYNYFTDTRNMFASCKKVKKEKVQVSIHHAKTRSPSLQLRNMSMSVSLSLFSCLRVNRRERLEGGMEVGGEGDYIYLSLHCHHHNDFCIEMGSKDSHFNVSVGNDGQSYKTVSTNHTLFEEKGEPMRYRTEVLPLTSLTPYR